MSEQKCKPIGRPRESLKSRFDKKVNREPTDRGCLIWIGNKLPAGYGIIAEGGSGGKMLSAHRLAWQMVNGPIPNGLCVLHQCDNPSCVNPDHLFLGTNSDNSSDMVRKGRQASGQRNGCLTHPEKVRRGEKHVRAKLTESDVLKIRSEYASGNGTMKHFALQYGVSVRCIFFVIHRRNWTHV